MTITNALCSFVIIYAFIPFVFSIWWNALLYMNGVEYIIKKQRNKYSEGGIIRYNVHNCYQHLPLNNAKQISLKISLPIHVMLYNLDGNMNIGMSIRSAAVFGCSDIWIVGKKSYDGRSCVGSDNYIRKHKVDSIDEDFFTQQGIQPFFIEQGGIPLDDMDFRPYMKKPVCFIVGSESHGIPKEVLQSMKGTPRITISQYGMIRSLNVCMASTIIIHEYLRQYRKASAIMV